MAAVGEAPDPLVSPLHPTLSHAPEHFPIGWEVCGEGEPASLTWTQEAQWGARVPTTKGSTTKYK